MLDNVFLSNRSQRLLNSLFSDLPNNITFCVYKQHDFPYAKTITDTFVKSLETHANVKFASYLKSINKKTTLIAVTILLNNENCNDVFFTQTDISTLGNVNFKVPTYQIFINAHYSDYHDTVNCFKTNITSYFNDKFANKFTDTLI